MRGRVDPSGVREEPELVAEAVLDGEAVLEEGVKGDLPLVEDGGIGVRRRLDFAHVCGRLDAEEVGDGERYGKRGGPRDVGPHKEPVLELGGPTHRRVA